MIAVYDSQPNQCWFVSYAVSLIILNRFQLQQVLFSRAYRHSRYINLWICYIWVVENEMASSRNRSFDLLLHTLRLWNKIVYLECSITSLCIISNCAVSASRTLIFNDILLKLLYDAQCATLIKQIIQKNQFRHFVHRKTPVNQWNIWHFVRKCGWLMLKTVYESKKKP